MLPAAKLAEPEANWNPKERRQVFEEISGEDKDFLREAGKSSLYILAKGILGYPDINPYTHKQLCERGSNDDSRRNLDLMPRAHLKSTIKTIANPIRVVIKEPENTAVLIASETSTQAQKFLKEIKRHWEANPVLRGLYPELVPERFTGPGTDWAQARATLRTDNISRQSHWETIGVGGAPTGNHYTRIVCDDLIGLEAYRSQAVMQLAMDWNDSIEPLLTDQHKDIIDWVGTRWKKHDLYQHIMEFYGSDISVYTRSAIENGQIIFPQLHTWEEYNRLQTKNPALWYAQFENNPIEGGPRDLPWDAIKNYYLTPDFQEVSFKDNEGSEKRWKVSDLYRVLTVDPNSGSPVAPDMAAITCVGCSPDDEHFALETWSARIDPHSLCWQVLRMGRRWKPAEIGIEKAGQQNTEFYFRKLCKEEGYSCRIEPLLPKGREKEDRIRYYVQPILASGNIYMLASQTVLREQMMEFPNNILIDELDAFAYALERMRRPKKVPANSNERRNRVLKLVMQSRNPRTGY